ncbi:unnamed protein product [Rotaria sordida]|uniref:Uncharacterized protein n=1 Tax=Rotaria sordida TaxID=392033 RepID=A0A819T7U4_9BILA|nr:unnamed protein product [Rotaria sordida]
MSSNQNMINTATSGSPPWSDTRDVACSPISFGSTIRSTSNEGSDHSAIPSSSLSLPSSNSSSSNTTPVLSSVSSMKPVSLISAELNDTYGVSSRRGSSSTANNINSNRW